jgi:acetoin utilization deacetylase AcuC-like enzyme
VTALNALSDVDLIEISELAEEQVRQLHDRDYVEFLMAIAEQLNEQQEYIPSIFHPDMRDSPLRFQGGMYCREIGTPIGARTIHAALNAAATALSAASHMLDTGSDAIALCRPPGHHAGKRRYGGYCYFNNAYLAAKSLAGTNQCCPVLDIDYHLGDGSIEFSNLNTPYFSLHADPWQNYPYLDSQEQLDYPHAHLETLCLGTDLTQYQLQLGSLLNELSNYQPDYAVVSLGLDTLASDAIQDDDINIQVKDFSMIGQQIGKKIQAPTLILLEGGYDLLHLGQCMTEFLNGFQSARIGSTPR